MAKITFRDLLVKISYVYLTDIYIYKNQFIIGGDISNENNPGLFICKLTNDSSELCDETLDRTKVYHVSDIKKSKDRFNEYLREVTNDDEINKVESLKNTVLNEIYSFETWNNFNFTEEEINDLFNDGISIEIFTENSKIPSLILSKSMIPLATEKNLDKLYYNFISSETQGKMVINKILFTLDHEFFQIYMYYRYMNW